MYISLVRLVEKVVFLIRKVKSVAAENTDFQEMTVRTSAFVTFSMRPLVRETLSYLINLLASF